MPDDLTKQTTPPVEATEATTPPADPPVEADPLMEALREAGFSDIKDKDEALTRVLAAYKQQAEFQSQLQAQVERALEEARQAAQPAARPDASPHDIGGWAWDMPQVDMALVAQYKTADGWKPETPHDVRQRYEAREAKRTQFANSLLDNPEAALTPLLEKKFREFFNKEYGQVASQQKEAQTRQEVFQANPWLFEQDPLSGRPNFKKLSSEGQLINDLVVKAQEMGVGTFEGQWEYAKAIHDARKAASGGLLNNDAAKAADAASKAALLQRANGGTTPRSGSLPPAPQKPTPNRNLRFGQRFQQNLQTAGIKADWPNV